MATDDGGASAKSSLLSAIRDANKMLYSMVVAQAQKVELTGDSLVFTFAPAHKSLKAQLEGKRAWIEQLAQTVVGRKIALVTKDGAPTPVAVSTADLAKVAKTADLKARAKSEPTVQAILDVFGGEIDTVEEVD